MDYSLGCPSSNLYHVRHNPLVGFQVLAKHFQLRFLFFSAVRSPINRLCSPSSCIQRLSKLNSSPATRNRFHHIRFPPRAIMANFRCSTSNIDNHITLGLCNVNTYTHSSPPLAHESSNTSFAPDRFCTIFLPHVFSTSVIPEGIQNNHFQLWNLSIVCLWFIIFNHGHVSCCSAAWEISDNTIL